MLLMNSINIGVISFKQKNGIKKIDELWINTGSRCNLSCIHCYVDSNPENDYLNQLSLSDIENELKISKKYGVEHIYFTGGEPFINKNIVTMIEAAIAVADTTILTNGTRPLRKYISQIVMVNGNSRNDLSLRISLDHYQAARHDLIRGNGKFNETFETVRQLYKAGFENVIITPTAEVYRGTNLTESQVKRVYKDLFFKEGISVSVKVIPAILEMGAQTKRAEEKHDFVRVTQSEIDGTPENLLPQCFSGRSIQKVGNKKMVLPCPILYDSQFNMGQDLELSLHDPVALAHKECYHYCMKNNGKCGN